MNAVADPQAVQARSILSDDIWAYLAGGSESETALRRNREALDALAVLPRVMNDVSDVDASQRWLGLSLRIPVMLAPIGSLHLLHPSGIDGVAQAARQAGVAYAAGSALPGSEDFNAPPGSPALFQLYVNGDEDWLDQQVASIAACGFKGVILTVDAPVFPVRQRDIDSVNHAANRQRDGTSVFRKTFTWRSLERLIQQHPEIPFILKGLQDPRDAERAAQAGVAAVYLSNHGGRQYDQGPGTASLISPVAQALQGKTRLIVDGGFRSANDILKAVALGADLVALGRSYLYPFACGGARALAERLDALARDLDTNMRLLGIPDLQAARDLCVLPSCPSLPASAPAPSMR